MAYYRGDYYRGDYYRGDPFLGKIVKGIGGAIKGFVTGGPLGAISGAVGAVIKRPTPTMLPAQQSLVAGPLLGAAGRAVGTIARRLPGIGIGVGLGAIPDLFGPNGGGGRRRTMNHLNPKALARATRRVEGFVKKARKAVSPLGYTVVRRGSGRCAPRRRRKC